MSDATIDTLPGIGPVTQSRLEEAGIRTVEDERAGARNYVALRAEWDHYVRILSPALNFSAIEVDPATTDPAAVERRPDFRSRRHSAK